MEHELTKKETLRREALNIAAVVVNKNTYRVDDQYFNVVWLARQFYDFLTGEEGKEDEPVSHE